MAMQGTFNYRKTKRPAPQDNVSDKSKRVYLGDVTNTNRQQQAAKTKVAAPQPRTEENHPPTNSARLPSRGRPAVKNSPPSNFPQIDIDDEFDHPSVFEIDAADDSKCTNCSQYAKDICRILFQSEIVHRPCDYINTVQETITPHMRGILLDWLNEVNQEYNLQTETLFLTKNYIDRYLSLQPCTRERLQLLGMACLLISAKFEEILSPSLDDLVYICDHAYTKDQIIQMEVNVLNTLNFDLCVATEYVFLRRFQKAAMATLPGTAKAKLIDQMSRYLTELTIPEYQFVMYRPSVIAAAAICVALHSLGFQSWSEMLEHHTGINMQNPAFRDCVKEIFALSQVAPNAALKAVYEKYLLPENGEVAKRIARNSQN
mmetsp:Transcript_27954/g.70140  ORF Transcript_27954/g.70140 Transcript_27954/m.70140 type:complete len:374 (-) Transcript_27954:96-1217(-)|eukprot:CAMPEP_0177652030 /NCGR_PEP_ID=MMETSP0447-20121125/12883_1 /TAXON_ID=0 /ORGANISM="Stygamoeba regulata, Strain BSH-02190019" /LENGTH=373 /DNA_ID=CAMNT_0019155189 /DNA_START=140 /DNA_END=1261 /DNA_ORIENTATION=-